MKTLAKHSFGKFYDEQQHHLADGTYVRCELVWCRDVQLVGLSWVRGRLSGTVVREAFQIGFGPLQLHVVWWK